jgi:uncharacterized protein involved in outer membrane biogenesis
LKKISIWAAAVSLVLAAIVAICVVAITHFDWNRAKPWLSERVSGALGRPFTIGGNLSVEWARHTGPQAGWRGWIPWPELAAQDVRIGNPAGFPSTGDVASVGKIMFSMNPLPVLAKKIVVSTLVLEGPDLLLERTGTGANNWTFNAAGPQAWQFEVDTIVLSKATVRLVDAIRHADLKLDLDTLAGQDAKDYGIAWKVAGTYAREKVSGSGRAGNVLSLRTQAAPYPIDADLHIGKTDIKATGTLTKPSDLTALDMRLRLSGASMAQLFPLVGVPLPETPAYATDGHLTGVLDKEGGDWVYEKFSGKVGASDLSGTLRYSSSQPRPKLTGEAVSNLLNFADLAPAIGADSSQSKAERGVSDTQPSDKVLPVEPFKTDRWRSVDVDVQFTGRRIVRDKALPFDNVKTHIRVEDGVLSLAPLDFGVAGGTLNSNVRLDGRAAAVNATLDLAARGLDIRQLFPTIPAMQGSLGTIRGDAKLSATGNSVALLLASSNGELKAAMSHGTISKLLIDEIGLNIGSVILAKLFGDKDVRLNCAVGEFTIAKGVMQTESVVVDTAQSTLNIEGRVDLAHELLNLKLIPESKSLRLVSFTGPLYVTGTFADPKVNIDRGVLALKAAAAVALAVVAPVAALIPLTSLGNDADEHCRELLARAKIKPVAPPPGTVRRARPAPA